MGTFSTIGTSELKQRLDRGDMFQFWNVLTDANFSNQMIPGSRRVPLDQIGREIAKGRLPKNTEIVVYCGGPQCPQSGLAAEKLQVFGYANVKVYGGGLEEWTAAGHEVEVFHPQGEHV